jgi:hypothetical protein
MDWIKLSKHGLCSIKRQGFIMKACKMLFWWKSKYENVTCTVQYVSSKLYGNTYWRMYYIKHSYNQEVCVT